MTSLEPPAQSLDGPTALLVRRAHLHSPLKRRLACLTTGRLPSPWWSLYLPGHTAPPTLLTRLLTGLESLCTFTYPCPRSLGPFAPSGLTEPPAAHLEPVHFPTANVVVHSAPKDVHGIRDDSSSMEEPPAGQLRKTSRQHNGMD